MCLVSFLLLSHEVFSSGAGTASPQASLLLSCPFPTQARPVLICSSGKCVHPQDSTKRPLSQQLLALSVLLSAPACGERSWMMNPAHAGNGLGPGQRSGARLARAGAVPAPTGLSQCAGQSGL